MKNTAILGASHKPERYAYKALKMLEEYNHATYLVHPIYKKIGDYEVFPDLVSLKESQNDIHTLAVYVNPTVLASYFDSILDLAPKRIILNPGTEHPELQKKFIENGIEVVVGCTLVMLRTNQF